MNPSYASRIPRLLRLLPLAGLCLIAAIASAGEPLPLDPNVHTGRLPNGISYYIQRNTKPEKRVELRLAVNTGSVQEDDDQLGIAHFVEHMAFRGTRRFPNEEVIHFLQSVGAQFGPDINAYTSFDETIYQLSIPSDVPATLDKGLDILADWAGAVTLDDAMIEKERSVVFEEWRLGRGADQRMRDKYIPVLFKDSKYAQRLPIGTKESIEHSTPAAVKRFYRDWYRPDNMAVVVVGDIDPVAIEAKINATFGSLPPVANPRPLAKIDVPAHAGTLSSIVSDKENRYNVAILGWKAHPETVRTTDDLRQSLARDLFVAMFNARLAELTQQANPPFLFSQSQHGRLFVRAQDAFLLTIVAPDGGYDRGLAAALTEAERVRRHGFSAAELDRAKKALLKNLEQAYNERDKTPSERLVGQYVANFLDSQPATGIAYIHHFAQQQVPAVTLAEIQPLAAQLIRPDNQVAVVMGTEKPGVVLPSEANLKAIVAQVAESKIDPYTEKQLANSLLKERPQPGQIVGGKPLPEIGGAELLFANGVRVILKPSDFKNDEVQLQGFRPGGQSVFPQDCKLAAEFAGAYLSESGAGPFSKVELQKMLAGKSVGVGVGLNLYFDEVKAMSSAADLETMLQLVHLYFTQVREDRESFASLETRLKAILSHALDNPQAYFQNETQKFLYSDHPRNTNTLPTAADWADYSFEKTLQVCRDRFAHANGFTFVLVGSFNPQTAVPLLATYLGSLPADTTAPAYRDLGIRAISGPADKRILRGSDPKSLALLTIEGDAVWTIEESHRLWSLGQILGRVLTDKLREDMAGVYTVNVSASLEKQPVPRFSFQVAIPCSPENVARLTAATVAEIERIQTAGLKPEEIQKEVESQRRSFEKDARENSAWLWKLIKIYRDGEGFTRLTQPEALVALVEPKGLQETAQKYLVTSKLVQTTLYPETTGAAAPR
jgi:zinc protease